MRSLSASIFKILRRMFAWRRTRLRGIVGALAFALNRPLDAGSGIGNRAFRLSFALFGAARQLRVQRRIDPRLRILRRLFARSSRMIGCATFFRQLTRPGATILAPEFSQARQSADRLGRDAAGLRTCLHLAAGGEIIEQLLEILRREVLVIILVDLHHRRVAAGPEALDLGP